MALSSLSRCPFSCFQPAFHFSLVASVPQLSSASRRSHWCSNDSSSDGYSPTLVLSLLPLISPTPSSVTAFVLPVSLPNHQPPLPIALTLIPPLLSCCQASQQLLPTNYFWILFSPLLSIFLFFFNFFSYAFPPLIPVCHCLSPYHSWLSTCVISLHSPCTFFPRIKLHWAWWSHNSRKGCEAKHQSLTATWGAWLSAVP